MLSGNYFPYGTYHNSESQTSTEVWVQFTQHSDFLLLPVSILWPLTFLRWHGPSARLNCFLNNSVIYLSSFRKTHICISTKHAIFFVSSPAPLSSAIYIDEMHSFGCLPLSYFGGPLWPYVFNDFTFCLPLCILEKLLYIGSVLYTYVFKYYILI